jgi:hypothetical protein
LRGTDASADVEGLIASQFELVERMLVMLGFEVRSFCQSALRAIAGLIVLSGLGSPALADLSLETETARLAPPGVYELSAAAEYQYARDDQEVAVPLALEFGLLPRLEIMLEPTAYVGIFPRHGKDINGIGDFEVTLTYLVLDEQKWVPAIAVAGEVKIPTARRKELGTREFDYTFYLIASKRIGGFDVHANLAYTFLGEPAGTRAKDTYQVALAFEYFINPKWDLFGEVMYTSSSIGSSSSGGGSAAGGEGTAAAAARALAAADTTDTGGAASGLTGTAELTGVETVGTLGLRYHLNPKTEIFGSVSYDNNDASLFRLGFTYRF